jgi:nucleoside-diphosphate-sugar epimerase
MNPSPPIQTSRPAVLILGANGRFGCAAAQAFDAAGWQVLAQVRREGVPALPAGAVLVRAPLTDTAALARAAAHARVVVHAVNPVYTRWEEEAMPALRAGLAVAVQLGAHFMLPGNVYNFGASMPAVLHEDTPQRPSTRKGEIRVAMEAEVERACVAAGIPGSVIRAGDFFGAGTGSWLDQLIVKSLPAGKLAYPGPLDLPHAWAYLPDLARAFVAVARDPAARGFQRLHFEGHTLTGAQLLAEVALAATALGLAPARGFRHGGMPWGLIAVVGWVDPMWRELARMAYLWRVPHALDGRALAARVDLASTPIAHALRESLLALGLAPRITLSSRDAAVRPHHAPGH